MRLAVGLVIAALVASLLFGCSAERSHRGGAAAGASSVDTVDVSVSNCGSGWSRPHPGLQRFVLVNSDTRAADVLLTQAKSGDALAAVEPLGPGATARLRIRLGSGRYAFRCAMEDADVVTGPTVEIPGRVAVHTRAVEPVTQQQLIGPTRRYERYVRLELPTLVRFAHRLRTSVGAGQRGAARRHWRAFNVLYQRLGAAYGAFGEADQQIDGLPDGLARGVHDPSFTGLHRIEYGLWNGQSLDRLAGSAARLEKDTRRLERTFALAQIPPIEIAIRAHEITENTIQTVLTGDSDFGSGSSLAVARANLRGTRVVLRFLRPLLMTRYPGLLALDAHLQRTGSDLDALVHGGRWPQLGELPRAQRERINADFSDLAERLASVATICEPRRTR